MFVKAGVEATGVEYPLRVEGELQSLVNRLQRRPQRAEHAGRLVGRAKGGGVAAYRRDHAAHAGRRQRGDEPALRAVPLDQLVAGQAEQRRRRRQRQTPERRVLVLHGLARGDEEGVVVVAQATPEGRGGGGLDGVATELLAGLAQRCRRAAQAHDEVAAPAAAGVERQGPHAPGVQAVERVARRQV
ncbi:MAG: hypothetical protein WKG52_07940, partial [Variovorax sp.]